jgi:hypothetical protein
MEKGRRKRRDRREDRVQGQSFMDVTRQAFVRHLALDKWREIEDLRETLGFDWAQAAQEACQFLARGIYAPLWIRQWRVHVLPAAGQGNSGGLFSAVEQAVAAALQEEEAARKSRGDRTLEEEPEYKGFLDSAIERLAQQSAAELESTQHDGRP